MANTIDFSNIQRKGLSNIMKSTQVYINYVATGEAYMLNPEEVESIVVMKTSRGDTQPMQQVSIRSNRTLAMLQMLRDNRTDEADDKHVTSLNVCVTFKPLPQGGQPKAWFGLRDEMKPLVDAGVIREGLTIDPNKLVLQEFTHPSPDMPNKTLAYIITDDGAEQ